MDSRSRATLTDAVLILLAIVAMFVVIAAGGPQKWAGASSATVAVFGVLLSEFRRYWNRTWFQASFTAIVIVHFVAIALLLQVILADRQKIPYPWWWAESFVEGIVAYVLLLYAKAVSQRKSATGRQHSGG